jgi:hypothetical protein
VQDKSPTNPGKQPTQAGAELREGERTDASDKGTVPTVRRMPEGYDVHEQRVGRAVGQWVLQVRCQCGRRWFEVEAIEATQCPRCSSLVYLDIQDWSK